MLPAVTGEGERGGFEPSRLEGRAGIPAGAAVLARRRLAAIYDGSR
jgi:hypothetical protein